MSDLFGGPAAGFDDPIGMLKACHERIQRHCATLLRLPAHLAEHGPDTEWREAAARIHRYFSTAGRHHHEDEEQDVFPRLRQRCPALAARMDALERDHVEMERCWLALEPHLQASIGGDREPFDDLCRRFAELYRAHIETEEALLADAQDCLSAQDRRELGSAMAQRRGIDPSAL